MRQLKLDFDKDNIIKNYWKNSNDIPIKVKKYIEKYFNNLVLQDMDTYELFCSFCLHKLNDLGVCSNCKKKYDIKQKRNFYNINIKNINKERLDVCYIVFDTPDNEILLYVIDAYITFDNPLSIKPLRNIYFKVEKVYYILRNRCINLINNNIYLYKDIAKKINEEKYVFLEDIDSYFEENNYIKYLYTDNLEDLKNTIYCYTYIWEAKSFLENKNVSLANLVYNPLYCSGFEYLIKYKLYNLAFDNIQLIKDDKDTREILNPKSEYLEFMVENNFNYWQLEALKLARFKDMQVINFMEDTVEIFDYLLKIKKIKILELYNYLKNNNNDIIEYYDYIRFAKVLGYDLDNKKVIYPFNLTKSHEEIINKKEIVVNKKYDKKIKELAKTLEKNRYEDAKYVIYPAPSVIDMINEGKAQNNCLRIYIEDYSENKTQIYFMREKKNLRKPLVTIEIKNKKLVQARLKNNEMPGEDIKNILNKWVSKLK